MDETLKALVDIGLPVEDAQDWIEDFDDSVASIIRSASPFAALLQLLLDAGPDVLEGIAGSAADLVELFRADPARKRRKARIAANEGRTKRAERLRARAYAIEERRGLPHPAEKR